LHAKEEKTNLYVKDPRWMGAFAVFAVGEVTTVSALGYGDQATINNIGTVGLISNAIFAVYMFGERFTGMDVLGTLCIILGSVLVVVFYQHNDQNFEGDEILVKLKAPLFLGSAIGMACVLAGCFAYWRRQAQKNENAGAVVHALIVAIIGSFSFTFGKMSVALIMGTFPVVNALLSPI
jgi:hypothetical protein